MFSVEATFPTAGTLPRALASSAATARWATSWTPTPSPSPAAGRLRSYLLGRPGHWTGDDVRIDLEGEATVGDTSDLALSPSPAWTPPVASPAWSPTQPYLGAAGPWSSLRADGSTFAHWHAETFDGRGPAPILPGSEFGPDLDLHVRFDRPGAYLVVGPVRARRRHSVTRPVRAPPAAGRRAPVAQTADTGR